MTQNSVSTGLPAAPVGSTHRSDLLRTPRPTGFVRIWRFVSEALERHRQRRALARLDARMLKDIGLTGPEVRAELDKPFWR